MSKASVEQKKKTLAMLEKAIEVGDAFQIGVLFGEGYAIAAMHHEKEFAYNPKEKELQVAAV